MTSRHVSIKLFATLGKFLPEDPERYPIAAGITVAALIDRLGIPASHVKLIFVNNVRCDAQKRLKGGERVGIFPPVGGG